MQFTTTPRRTLITVTAMLLLAACGDDSDASDDPPEAEETDDAAEDAASGDENAETLVIQVTNDDGIDAPGIDAVVEALDALDAVDLHVIAPYDDWSGSGASREEGDLEAEDSETLSGHAGTAVHGRPADTVVWAHEDYFGDDIPLPHLTVSGTNGGQNIGEVAYISGTVGAARQSARQGVPGLAVSTGFGEDIGDYDAPDYDATVPFMVDWIEDNRAELLAGDIDLDTVTSINVPTCLDGEVRGLVETDRQEPGDDDDDVPNALDDADCASDVGPDGLSDVAAFMVGFATLTTVDVENAEEDPHAEDAEDSDEDSADDDEGDNGDSDDDSEG